jgi:hypothetical protein
MARGEPPLVAVGGCPRTHPTHRVELNAAELSETFTTYMGCESRLVQPYTGRSIPCGARRNTVCDAYGHQVGLAVLPGAPFTDCQTTPSRTSSGAS